MTRLFAASPYHVEELTEKQLELQAIGTKAHPGVARQVGFRCYHTLRSKGSEAGYPDWTLVRERAVWLEFKRASGKVSEAQKEWLRALLAAGQEAYLIRPASFERLAIVLSARVAEQGAWPNARARDAALKLAFDTARESE